MPLAGMFSGRDISIPLFSGLVFSTALRSWQFTFCVCSSWPRERLWTQGHTGGSVCTGCICCLLPHSPTCLPVSLMLLLQRTTFLQIYNKHFLSLNISTLCCETSSPAKWMQKCQEKVSWLVPRTSGINTYWATISAGAGSTTHSEGPVSIGPFFPLSII